MGVTAVGSVYVDVVPSARDFVRKMTEEILPGADALGRELGERIGREAARRVAEGIEDGVSRADVTRPATRQGRRSGDAFGRAFKAEVRAALASLPDIDLESNPAGVFRDIAAIRAELESLSDQEIGVDLTSGAALAQARALRAQLELLRDQNIEVNVDFDLEKAISSLGKLEKDIARRAGGSFENALRDGLRNAISSLPEIDLNVDGDSPLGALARIRTELEAFSDLADVDLNINGDLALRDVARLRTQLQAIADDTSVSREIRINAASALAGLQAIESQARSADRQLNDLGRTFQTEIVAALANFTPELEIGANINPARAEFRRLRLEFEALRDLDLDIELNTEDVDRDTARIIAQLEALAADTVEIEIQLATSRIIENLRTIRAEAGLEGQGIGDAIEEGIERGLGGFAEKIRRELQAAQALLPDIEVGADTAPALREVADLRAILGAISANINIDTNIDATLAHLAVLQERLNAIDNDDLRINVREDIASVIAKLVALRAAAAAVGDGVERGLGADTAGKINRIRLILGLILLLFPLIAGAILGLSAAIALVVTPIAAIAAGLDGIKRAVAPLADELVTLKQAVSAAFEAGLQPAVEKAARAFPVLTDGLVGTAFALSDVADGVLGVVTESRNLDTISDSFDKINQVITATGPAINLLTQNMIDLTNIGAGALVGFGEELRQVGQAFADVIARLKESGTAEAAVRALFQVIAELLNLLAPLTELGAVLLASFGPALAAALSVVGAAFGTLAQAIDALPGPLQAVVSIALILATTLLILGRTFPTLAATSAAAAAGIARLGFAAVGVAATFAGFQARLVGLAASIGITGVAARIAAAPIATLGVAFRGLLAALGGPIGAIITLLVVGLSFLGIAQGDAAASADEHKAAVQQLADALRDSGGAVDANVLALANQRLESEGAAESAKQLGLNQLEVAAAVAQGGPAFDALTQKLRGLTEVNAEYVGGIEVSTTGNAANAASAQKLLSIINPLRQSFVDAAAANQLYSDALSVLGFSLVGGITNATALDKAFSTLGNAASTTSDKVKALNDALNALDGGSLSAEESAAKLEQSIDEIGVAFTEAAKAADKSGAALINVAGQIDTTTEGGRKLFDATLDIREGMLAAATGAFDAAGGLSNVEAASAAAASKVQAARDAFIKGATAAGISASAANDLANEYNLIPSLITTLLTITAEGLPQVNQELLQLSGLIQNQVPGTKEITVRAISEEARGILTALGIQTRELPSGEIVVGIDDQTVPALGRATDFIEQQKANLPLGLDAKPIQAGIAGEIAALEAQKAALPVQARFERQELDSQIGQLKASRVDVPVGANTDAIQSQIAAEIASLQATKASLPVQFRSERQELDSQIAALMAKQVDVPVGGELSPFVAALSAAVAQASASTAVVVIDGNPVPASAALATILAAIGQGQAAVSIDGEIQSAQAALESVLGIIAGSTAPVTIDGNTTPADAALRATLEAISNGLGFVTINGKSESARAVLAALLGSVEAASAFMTILGRDGGVAALKAVLSQPSFSTHTITVREVIVTSGNQRASGPQAGFAQGGFIVPMADGGILNQALRPMSAKAAKVPANTWRVIGDNMKVPEIYAPLDGSARSLSFLKAGIESYGLGVAPMASGGILSISESLLRLAQGSPGAVSTQSAGAFSSASGRLNDARSQVGGLGGGNGGVEKKLDTLIETVRKTSGPAQITVEDRSGNPTQTARAVSLSLRLKR